ncbi:asparagine synthase-related protein [Streptomyces sp. NPDC058464]|uniref:asparagine synthase-related protein n=1 Tax=Streptomyces sp. NPDC058464 TaxID=3346511 RepID=UPI003655E32A
MEGGTIAEADKDVTWIKNESRDVQSNDRDDQHRAHAGLNQVMQHPGTTYTQAFLQTGPSARQAVTETSDILWVTWNEAIAGPDALHCAGELLTRTVEPVSGVQVGSAPCGHAQAYTCEAGEQVSADLSGGLDSSTAVVAAARVSRVVAVTYGRPLTGRVDTQPAARVTQHTGAEHHISPLAS